eukprot:TRINITY_DN2722_c0_g2_i1.p1 TRINITY_DN2722_c0_g2~~TRINITY_DN2722_c0_g2_i1.p1  ORF type:complete len:183 (+),score=41.05 TRINITY_DN2722_c0_g2_i1:79-627(+)
MMSQPVPWQDGKVYLSYEQIHQTIYNRVEAIKEFKPDLILAIGGGGFIPGSILRNCLKIPIISVVVSLYHDEAIGAKVNVSQWLDESANSLISGKRVLIVDEVDDTRTTLEFCTQAIQEKHSPAALGVFVLHNKDKPKKGVISSDIWYCAGLTVTDAWLMYPWEISDIIEHTKRSQPTGLTQ